MQILKGQGGMTAFGEMDRFNSDLAHNLTLGGKKKRNTADTCLSLGSLYKVILKIAAKHSLLPQQMSV